MQVLLARLFSILGHPAIMMSLAAVLASRNTSRSTAAVAVGCTIVLTSLVLGYSKYKAHRGDWLHIDASEKSERAELNRAIGSLLVAAAIAIYFLSGNKNIVLATALSGVIVLFGHILRKYCKPSLHAAFAVFSALLVWPYYVETIVLLGASIAISWSRLVLLRHTLTDVIAGASLGFLAGIAFQVFRSSV